MQFNQPTGGGSFFKPAEAHNHLILITVVHRHEQRFDNLRNAEITQAIVDLVDLDEERQDLREGVILSHAGIVNKTSPGQTNILGRIGQVTTRSNMQAWALLPFTEGQDDQRAAAWLTAFQAAQVRQPAPPTPAAPAVPPPGVNGATGEVVNPQAYAQATAPTSADPIPLRATPFTVAAGMAAPTPDTYAAPPINPQTGQPWTPEQIAAMRQLGIPIPGMPTPAATTGAPF